MTIKKFKGRYRVLSKKTKRNMGTYKTKVQAQKRIGQIEYFKERKNKRG
jgi:hypothetical protein